MDSKDVSINLFVKNNPDIIELWFRKMKIFKPTRMSMSNYTDNKRKRYVDKNFYEELNREISEGEFKISYYGVIMNNWISSNKYYKDHDSVLLSAYLEREIYDDNEGEILILIDGIMENNGIVGRMVESKSAYSWVDKLVKSDSEELIDIEKLPGYEVEINNIWYGASWKMWFNTPYYEYVPKNIIENYKDCYKNEKISSECICITLYEDMSDYNNPIHKELQVKFKEAINFDELVKKAEATVVKKPVDPHTAIEFGDYKNGGKRRVINYLDDEEKSTRRSKAVQAEVVYCDGDGKFLFVETKPIDEID